MTASNDRRIHLDPEILGPEDSREERIRERLWSTVKRAARSIPFIEEVVAAWYCALDPATPNRVRLTLLAALAYFVAPIDVVPDAWNRYPSGLVRLADGKLLVPVTYATPAKQDFIAVRTSAGDAPFVSPVGEYNWAGAGGTAYWADPKNRLATIFMMQSPKQRVPYRSVLRNMVYAAIEK